MEEIIANMDLASFVSAVGAQSDLQEAEDFTTQFEKVFEIVLNNMGDGSSSKIRRFLL